MTWNQFNIGTSGGTGGGGGGGPDNHQTQIFSATNGQTLFTLTALPVDPVDVEMTVNGIEQTYGVDFTVSGGNLTWLNTNFSLSLGDEVTIDYDF